MTMRSYNRTQAIFSALLAAALLAATAGTATAHHSFAAFNMNEEKSVTGIVKQVEWTNPHIWIWVDVRNENGAVDVYGFEGMSPNYLERRNWTRTTLKPGDKVTVSYRPLKDGKHGGMFVNGKMENGLVLTMGGAR
jgi:hypothetical protein